MEQWHQKLHNNSSPDDLVICEALLEYLASGQQQQVYWDTLAKQGRRRSRECDLAVTLVFTIKLV